MPAKFTHLHVHTEYSLLDGLSKIGKLLAKAKEYGQDALAITDHGSMYGAIDFYKQCTKENIKPIIGCEIYMSAGSHLDKVRQDAFHLILLSFNKQGYENLMKIVTLGQTEGFYYKPRVDKEILNKFHEGLIATTACPAGLIQRLLVSEGIESARKQLIELEQIFGPSNLYLELQRHHYDKYAQSPNLPEKIKSELLNLHKQTVIGEEGLLQLAKELGLPIIATNDVHYINKDDAAAQDALVCVQTGKLISDINRMRYLDTPDFYLKSGEEMTLEFPDLPQALTNTTKIADRVELDLVLGQWQFPHFEIPPGRTASQELYDMAYAGCRRLYGEVTEELQKRLDYELEIIDTKGYSPYFLIYQDLVGHCNKIGIYTNTRGSAAGSLVSYCCGITTVDPIRFNLPFERFLNPFRPSLPDIDLDISDDRRNDLIDYIKRRYGDEKVGQICTFGKMKARAAARDIGRVLGMPYSAVDRVAKMIPEGSQGFPMTITKALKTTPELEKAYKSEPETKILLDLSQKVEGNARHISVHAAAVVIAPEELTKFTPLQLEPGGGDKVITQYEMHACEDAGLVKLDILGIRNLSILANAINIVKKVKGVDIDIHELPLDDKKTFEILSQGETFGVFQLGGSGMTKYLMDLQPERVEDLMAMVALYRPGPMGSIPEYIKRKRDPKLVSYFDPRMEEYLSSSYGILTYQDDVLYTAIKLSDYNWGEADKFRKAIGKKIPEEMAAQHERFVTGCVENGMSNDKAEELFGLIETFAAYGFNKAHASSYGIVSYWTAYAKAHYPVEYLTALMSAEAGNTDKLTEAIGECEKLGIRVLAPDINESLSDFTIVDLPQEKWLPTGRAREEGKAIRFGFGAIKNVGNAAISVILKARESGVFTSLTDLIYRVDSSKLNKKILESLIKAGALDRFGKRSALLAVLPEIKDKISRSSKNKNTGQVDMFETSINFTDNLPAMSELPMSQLLSFEKQLLGFYLTDHPARNIMKIAANRITHTVSQIDPKFHQGQNVTLAGILSSVRLVNTKKNNHKMAFATLEDNTGKIDLVIFPKLYADSAATWVIDKPVLVTGKVDNRDNSASVVVDKVKLVDINTPTGSVFEITIPRGVPKETLQKINSLLKSHPGDDTIFILIQSDSDTKKIRLSYTVDYKASLDSQIKDLLS